MKNFVFLGMGFLFLTTSGAWARPAYFSQLKQAYPNGKAIPKFQCNVCHGGNFLNYYGQEVSKNAKTPDGKLDFKLIENLDSDGDGVTNKDEIMSGTNPGEKNQFRFLRFR